MSPLVILFVVLAGLVVLPWDPAVLPGPLLRDTTPTPADMPVDKPEYSRKNVGFPCSGEVCDAWLFTPKGIEGKPPVVIMGHGLGAQKDFGLDTYAQSFAKDGMAVFAFDYRTFGGSSGEPRHWASPKRHVEDWKSAVAFIQSKLADRLDAKNIALWGSSLGGGHVLKVSADLGDQIAAVIAQVPFLDGKPTFHRNLKTRGPFAIFRGLVAALHDNLRSLANYPAAYYPLAGDPGSFSLMQLDEAEMQAYVSKHPPKKQGGWRNMACARFVLEASSYRPILSIPNITAPVLFLAAKTDKLCPVESIEAAAKLAPKGEVLTVDCNHFQIYTGSTFETVMKRQVEFVRKATGWPGRQEAEVQVPGGEAIASEPETS